MYIYAIKRILLKPLIENRDYFIQYAIFQFNVLNFYYFIIISHKNVQNNLVKYLRMLLNIFCKMYPVIYAYRKSDSIIVDQWYHLFYDVLCK